MSIRPRGLSPLRSLLRPLLDSAVAWQNISSVTRTARIVQRLGGITQQAQGDAGIGASIVQTLSAVRQSGVIGVEVYGPAAQRLFPLTQSIGGFVSAQGGIAQTLGSVTQDASGTVAGVVGEIVTTLSGVEQRADVWTNITADATSTLFGVYQVADATERDPASIVQTLGELTQEADGIVIGVVGSVAQTLSSVEQRADVWTNVTATDAQQLFGIETQDGYTGGEAHGEEEFIATAAQTLHAIKQSATAVFIEDSYIVQALAGVTQSAVGRAEIEGHSVQTLSLLEQTAAAVEKMPATIAQTLSLLKQSAAAVLVESGSSSQMLSGVRQSASATVLNLDDMIPQGRLTLTSGVPFLTSDVTAAATIYYTPAVGVNVPLWNGSAFVPTTFSEISQALSDTTKSPAASVANAIYDMFVWSDSGTIRCTRGPAWVNAFSSITATHASPCVFTASGMTATNFPNGTPVQLTGSLPGGFSTATTYYVVAASAGTFELSATIAGSAINSTTTGTGITAVSGVGATRGTGAGTSQIQMVNGVLVNQNSITNGPVAGYGTYVGTVMTDPSNTLDVMFNLAASNNTVANTVGVWNMYNRRQIASITYDSTASWSYSTNAFRLKRASFPNQIICVVGVQEDVFEACNVQSANGNGSTLFFEVGVGVDSVTAATAATLGVSISSGVDFCLNPTASFVLAAGLHTLSPLEEWGSSGSGTWKGPVGTAKNTFTFTGWF